MWIAVLEMWAINEEKYQFNSDREYKHDLLEEFEIYQKLKDIYQEKMTKIERLHQRRATITELEEDLNKISQKPGLLMKMKAQILGEPLPSESNNE